MNARARIADGSEAQKPDRFDMIVRREHPSSPRIVLRAKFSERRIGKRQVGPAENSATRMREQSCEGQMNPKSAVEASALANAALTAVAGRELVRSAKRFAGR